MSELLNELMKNREKTAATLRYDGEGYNKLKAAAGRAKNRKTLRHIDEMLDELNGKAAPTKVKPRFQASGKNNRYKVKSESLDDTMNRVNQYAKEKFGESAFNDDMVNRAKKYSGKPSSKESIRTEVPQKYTDVAYTEIPRQESKPSPTKSVQETLDDLSVNHAIDEAGAGIKAPARNRYLKPLAIGAGAAAAVGGGAYLYNRYKKKKQTKEQEKTAGLLDDLIRSAAKKSVNKSLIPGRQSLGQRAVQNSVRQNMQKAMYDSMAKKASYEEEEKTAVTKEEKEQLRRMTGMSKRKVKKQKPNKTKESMYRMKKQRKKVAAFDDVELEKMASLMADQFIAASALSTTNSEQQMGLEEEIIAGYKSYIDEVNS